MTLTRFIDKYIAQRDLSVDYAGTLRKRARALQEFAGKSVVRYVLKEDIVNAFLKQLPKKLSAYTVSKYRQDFLTMWRAAADVDLCPYPTARRIWQPKKQALIIECLSHDEIEAIVAAAGKLRGCLEDGRPRRHYWTAIIRAAWDTGLRRGDLWRITDRTAGKDGSFKIVQNKSKKIVRCTLRPSTIEAIRLAGGTLEWPHCFRSFTYGWQRIVEQSGIGREAQFRWVRRGVGSAIESMQPGAGAKALGNTDQVFRLHYDAQLRPVELPQTPEVAIGGGA